MCNISYRQQVNKLAGQIAFLKSFVTGCGQDTARDAVQVFDGRGITQSGMGKYIEHYHRNIASDAGGRPSIDKFLLYSIGISPRCFIFDEYYTLELCGKGDVEWGIISSSMDSDSSSFLRRER